MKSRFLFLALFLIFLDSAFVLAKPALESRNVVGRGLAAVAQGTPESPEPHPQSPSFDLDRDSGGANVPGDLPDSRIAGHPRWISIFYPNLGLVPIPGPGPLIVLIEIDGSSSRGRAKP